MDVVWLPDVRPRERHVAVGEFDGVHLGHREVIRGADTVLTFEPHPRTVVAPDSAPKLLTSLETKADLISELGVRELVVIPFDGSFAAQTAQEFIDHELVGRLGARQVSVGENFRFGNRARGDAGLLRSQTAFRTRVARLVELEGEIISSTHIRGLVAAGWPAPRASWARRFRSGARSRTATSAGARSGTRPPTSCPTRGWSCPTTACTRAAPRSTTRRMSRR
jgi:riboflavin kinase/FMN adenylyltransferase